MSPQRREIRSGYIEWSKLRSGARYNLATSDILHFPLSELPVRIEDLEITGSSAYGYKPLLERSEHHRRAGDRTLKNDGGHWNSAAGS